VALRASRAWLGGNHWGQPPVGEVKSDFWAVEEKRLWGRTKKKKKTNVPWAVEEKATDHPPSEPDRTHGCSLQTFLDPEIRRLGASVNGLDLDGDLDVYVVGGTLSTWNARTISPGLGMYLKHTSMLGTPGVTSTNTILNTAQSIHSEITFYP
jgi:hypothetical protein